MSKLEDLVKYGMYGAKRAVFIAPMMYATELISGLQSSQSLKSRTIALGVNFFVAMPYNNWFRPKIYDMLGVKDDSSEYKKNIANRVAFAAHQLPLYAGILLAAGASAEQIAVALPTGVAVGVATAGRFQNFMDRVSNFIENKYYKTKDKVRHIKELGKTYGKNLAYASLIAAMTKVGITNSINYVRNNNIFTNKDEIIFVVDNAQPDSMYWIRKENFDRPRHAPIFSE